MKRLFYDMRLGEPAPIVGKYLVSIGKKGIGTVYLIHEVRKVKSKVAHRNRHSLMVMPQEELKPYTVHDPNTWQVWVRGEPAYPVVWYGRTKKRKP